MRSCETMIQTLQEGVHDDVLRRLYALDGLDSSLEQARKRAVHVAEGFREQFQPGDDTPVALFSGPGRTEIGGNHTDHQRGHVICGSVDLDMLACTAANSLNTVRICSEGFPTLEVDLSNLEPQESERNTSAALVRGIAARLQQMGYTLQSFDAYVTSNVLPGSGLSSSAAYEVLIANILNYYSGGTLDAIEIAKVGKYAENVYFGKPSGLMDQMGSSVGSVVAIDFCDPDAPVVRKVDFDLARYGYSLCIIDTGSCHADLTDDYSEIPAEMKSVAAYFGKQVLREVPEEDVYAAIPALRERCGDRAVLRAIHFYDDDRKAVAEADAVSAGDFDAFLALINASGVSSMANLQNIWAASDPQQQAVSVALALGKKLLGGTGAIRVHGGGFAGTIQAFVPNDKLASFKAGMEAVLGEGKCFVLHIRAQGGGLVLS